MAIQYNLYQLPQELQPALDHTCRSREESGASHLLYHLWNQSGELCKCSEDHQEEDTKYRLGKERYQEDEDIQELYKKHTSDTSGIAKKVVEGYPELCFLKKDEKLKSVRLLDVDKLNVANKELMVGFIDYFKDQWTEKFIEKIYGPGKNKIS
ncbi:hypothetical protein DSO57_1033144 [Entomophthora muscae]|uniref:Uncharacterized protein n=1 Tax=Entomophthora muscae TaxID=34485 RepID=A0ACC2RR71_9FUNG|nr:hypothetical protein DSO57_1033144 [Entomophthora muscae]